MLPVLGLARITHECRAINPLKRNFFYQSRARERVFSSPKSTHPEVRWLTCPSSPTIKALHSPLTYPRHLDPSGAQFRLKMLSSSQTIDDPQRGRMTSPERLAGGYSRPKRCGRSALLPPRPPLQEDARSPQSARMRGEKHFQRHPRMLGRGCGRSSRRASCFDPNPFSIPEGASRKKTSW